MPDTRPDPPEELEEAQPEAEEVDPELLDTSRYRVTDAQALALLVGYLVFRQITARVGLGMIPKLAAEQLGWLVPLMNNSMIALITITIPTWTDETMRYLIGMTSLVQSAITGAVLYWAGWRFGPELAKKAADGHAAWASIWNPKQVGRAHRWLERRGWFAITLGRVVEFLTTAVALVAGSSRMTFRKYFAAWMAGSVLFVSLHTWLGGRIATRWPWLEDRILGFANWSLRISLILLVLVVLMFFLAPGEKKGSAGEVQDDALPSEQG